MKKILILTVTILLAFGANAQGKAAKANTVKGPGLLLDKEVVDYGSIDKGAEGTRKIRVSNNGSEPLLLTNCSGSCGCTVPTCPREPILPGKSAEISIKYDTNREGPINKQVNIATNDPNNPNKVVMVKGEVKAAAHN